MKHQGGHTAETSVGGVSKALINVCTHLPAETGCNPLAAVCIMKDGQFLVVSLSFVNEIVIRD